ncbi:MAG: aminotransferase class V-fold PLP-dependent enzyme, partial [Inquilinus sp.]|nr:aminotransferase class V-fold PLP-dependent enzyme [Inquilinus sp.]
EQRRRAGTENVAASAGFGAAAQAALGGLDDFARLAVMRDRLEGRIVEAFPDTVVFGAGAQRLVNTSCLAMPGLTAETQLMAFDLAGIAVSAGAACSSGKIAESHVLRAMGIEPKTAATAIRVSLGWNTTQGDIDALVDAWIALRRRSAATVAA